jgi:hypothetical protein
MKDKRLKIILDKYSECKAQYKKAEEAYKKSVKVFRFVSDPCYAIAHRYRSTKTAEDIKRTRRDAADICKEAKNNLKQAQRNMTAIAMIAGRQLHS